VLAPRVFVAKSGLPSAQIARHISCFASPWQVSGLGFIGRTKKLSKTHDRPPHAERRSGQLLDDWRLEITERRQMTNEQVEIVKRTMVRIFPPRPEGSSEIIIQRYEKARLEASKAFGDVFFPRLFELAPHLKDAFTDPDTTAQQLGEKLPLFFRSMNRLHDTLNTMQELGVDYMKAGVKLEDYQPLVAAILWAFRQRLGEEVFNEDVAKAYVAVLSRVFGIMCNAAYPEARGIAS
jgi:hemoglobin-like flavoprotein